MIGVSALDKYYSIQEISPYLDIKFQDNQLSTCSSTDNVPDESYKNLMCFDQKNIVSENS